MGTPASFASLQDFIMPDTDLGFYSLLPDFVKGFLFQVLLYLGKLQFREIFSVDFIVILFAFLFIDLFDTIRHLSVYLPKQIC